jgi:hypothetical protein
MAKQYRVGAFECINNAMIASLLHLPRDAQRAANGKRARITMCLRRMGSFRWIRMFLIRLITSEAIFLFKYHLTRDEAAFLAAGSRGARQLRLSAWLHPGGRPPGPPLRDCVPQTP